MWPFRKRISLADSGIFRGFTDWHCHLLPGVDDGARTMEESLQILSLYEKLGVNEVWLTPHIMEDMPNTTSALKARFEELEAAYQGNIVLHLASENMLDNLFEERLAKNDLLPLGKDGKHLLVETSYFNPPMGLSNILLRVKSKGYYPALAHPERYNYMDESNYRQLKGLNVKFQLNLFSLAGAYGAGVRKKAGWLMKNGFYDLAGSDMHGLAILEDDLYKKRILGNMLNATRHCFNTFTTNTI
ncbi:MULTISPECIES: tyrosine-protein phosphatase [Bacteroidales]|mgnify:CR=1 FL=1|uniref:tyrosine-protein phosphatase n=1 Tax=Bacteroidales TaxID=171549 RepID=UPI00189967C3|nr:MULTISPECIES: CpsB/CapC family capsule biosynthesis tyrosine phosphatase [Bacteroidales]MDB9179210.1 capsular biosynthesis protein [Parabacteroides distasonis]